MLFVRFLDTMWHAFREPRASAFSSLGLCLTPPPLSLLCRRLLLFPSAKKVGEACVLIIPSWRHHLIQYDCLSACLEALKISTAVEPLPDGLWAFLLQRLQVKTSQDPVTVTVEKINPVCESVLALVLCTLRSDGHICSIIVHSADMFDASESTQDYAVHMMVTASKMRA